MSMISELVEKLRDYANGSLQYFLPKYICESLNQAADTIEELSAKLSASQMERSSQYYHGGWIPCEERMPEITINGMYSDDMLVSVKWDDGDIDYDIAWYNASGSWNADSKNRKVIAWRPLPEPYREVRDETD